MNVCPECRRTLSRRDVMLRHRRNLHYGDQKHETTSSPSQRYMRDMSPPMQHYTQRDSPLPMRRYAQRISPPPMQRYTQRDSPPPDSMQHPDALRDNMRNTPPPDPMQHAYPPREYIGDTPLLPQKTNPLPLEPCSSIMIAGPTGSGKTRCTSRRPEKSSTVTVFTRTYLTLYPGVPIESEIEEFADGEHDLIVLDDLMHEVLNSKTKELMFTRGCLHRKLSVVFITQNIYGQGKSARTITLNCWYMVLFKNMGGTSQIQTLGRQLFPGKSPLLTEAFDDATKEPFGYLLNDLTPRGKNEYRLMTQVFRDEDIVYKSL